MFFSAANNNFEYGIGYATSNNGIEWTKNDAIDPYTYQDDPYAELNDFYVVAGPAVILNADSSYYHMYYHYGIFIGEIGMATAPNLSVGVSESIVSEEEINCNIYPNPSGGIVNCQFSTVDFQSVSLKVYDLHGREVTTISDEHLPAGEHQVTWNAEGLPAGIYFVRMVTDHGTASQKLILY
jgi:hypothetical protein